MKKIFVFFILAVSAVSYAGPAAKLDGLNFHWSAKAIGTYKSEIYAGKTPLPGTTVFFQGEKIILQGSYSFQYGNQTLSGVLEGCTPLQDRTIKCRWRDRQITGMLIVQFSPDFNAFNGFWSTDGRMGESRWNGVRAK